MNKLLLLLALSLAYAPYSLAYKQQGLCENNTLINDFDVCETPFCKIERIYIKASCKQGVDARRVFFHLR